MTQGDLAERLQSGEFRTYGGDREREVVAGLNLDNAEWRGLSMSLIRRTPDLSFGMPRTFSR